MIYLLSFVGSLKRALIRRLITGHCKWIHIVYAMIDFTKIYKCDSHYPENVIYRIQNEFRKDKLKSFVNLSRKAPSKNQLWLQNPLF